MPARAHWRSHSAWIVHAIASTPALLAVGTLIPAAAGAASAAARQPTTLLAPFLRWTELLGSLGYAAAIALLATLAAWPVASAARDWPPRRLALLAAPLMLPSYLAYAGWTLLRAPGTALGDAIFRLGQTDGWAWAPVAAGRAMAVWGLGLWAWPIAAVVLWLGWQRVGAATLDALRLDAPTRAHAAVERARLMRAPLIAAFGLVGVVMLGSAIPLHVAQAKTHAIGVWLVLDQSAPGERWRAWIAGWPLVVAGAAAAPVVVRGLRRAAVDELPERRRATPGARGWLWPVLVLGLSAGVPVALFARALAQGAGWSGVVRFVSLARAELIAAGAHAAVLALCAFALAASAARLAADRPRLASAAVAVLVACALVPGVLVGAAIAETTGRWPATGPWAHVPALLAMLARVVFVGAAVGLWVGLSEPQALRDLRRVEGCETWRGWWRARGPGAWSALALGAVASAVLGLHEIEAAVQVNPPGSASLARLLLNYLHFARDDDLSAAVVLLTGAGLLGGVALAFGSRAGRAR